MCDVVDRHLGKRLRHRRRLLEITQKQVAMACGVRFQQIQKYEYGDNCISASRLWALANVLGVPVSYFYDGLPSQAEPQVTERDLGDNFDVSELVRIQGELDERSRRRLRRLATSLSSAATPTHAGDAARRASTRQVVRTA